MVFRGVVRLFRGVIRLFTCIGRPARQNGVSLLIGSTSFKTFIRSDRE